MYKQEYSKFLKLKNLKFYNFRFIKSFLDSYSVSYFISFIKALAKFSSKTKIDLWILSWFLFRKRVFTLRLKSARHSQTFFCWILSIIVFDQLNKVDIHKIIFQNC